MRMIGEPKTRAACAVIGAVVLFVVMVLTHRGEFWPFSVFPMYSRGKDPWQRPLILEIQKTVGVDLWRETSLDDLPGDVFSMFEKGVRRGELRTAFDTNETWEKEEIVSLRSLVGEDNIRGRHLLLMNVRGELARDGGVFVECVPLVLLTEDATRMNPAFEN